MEPDANQLTREVSNENREFYNPRKCESWLSKTSGVWPVSFRELFEKTLMKSIWPRRVKGRSISPSRILTTQSCSISGCLALAGFKFAVNYEPQISIRPFSC